MDLRQRASGIVRARWARRAPRRPLRGGGVRRQPGCLRRHTGSHTLQPCSHTLQPCSHTLQPCSHTLQLSPRAPPCHPTTARIRLRCLPALHGAWCVCMCMARDAWCMAYSAWSMTHGAWCMARAGLPRVDEAAHGRPRPRPQVATAGVARGPYFPAGSHLTPPPPPVPFPLPSGVQWGGTHRPRRAARTRTAHVPRPTPLHNHRPTPPSSPDTRCRRDLQGGTHPSPDPTAGRQDRRGGRGRGGRLGLRDLTRAPVALRALHSHGTGHAPAPPPLLRPQRDRRGRRQRGRARRARRAAFACRAASGAGDGEQCGGPSLRSLRSLRRCAGLCRCVDGGGMPGWSSATRAVRYKWDMAARAECEAWQHR